MTLDTSLPAQVRAVLDTYLRLLDQHVPGLVDGVHLSGSVALDEYRPGRSDIDFVALTSRTPDGDDLAGLAAAHAAVVAAHPGPHLDGPYLTGADLTRDPARCGPVPYAFENRFHPAGRFEVNPITWHTLAAHGITVTGTAVSEQAVWTDADVLAAWCRSNLDTYWRDWTARSARLFSRYGLGSMDPRSAEWGACGVSRLRYTLDTGLITSKAGAAEYALETADPRWHRIIAESLRMRRGGDGASLYRNPLRRRRDLLGYLTATITELAC